MNPANLVQDEYGIWTRAGERDISYPAGGHGLYMSLEDRSFWFAHRNRCILAALRRYPPAGPVLDVGGGNGYVAKALLDAGFSAAVLEPGPVGAFNAKTLRGIPEVFRATLEETGFPPGSIDAIGCFDVIEHVRDDFSLVDRFAELLSQGGYVYGTVPAYPWLWSGSDVGDGHFRRYNVRGLRKLLASRLDVVYLTPFFTALVLPVLVGRALPYRLGLGQNLVSTEAEHGTSSGVSAAARLMAGLLGWEAGAIGSGRTLAMGTSLLFVARKIGGVKP